jgi:pectate lyase
MSHLQRMGTSARSAFLAAPSKLTNTFVGGKGASPSTIQHANDADAAAEAKGDQA